MLTLFLHSYINTDEPASKQAPQVHTGHSELVIFGFGIYMVPQQNKPPNIMTMRPIFCLACVVTSGFSVADPVDESALVPLQAGAPARAADLNQTVDTLVAALNDNAQRIAALEARLLEANKPTVDKLKGSTFRVYSYKSAVGSGEANIPGGEIPIVSETFGKLGMYLYSETVDLTLNADGTLAVTGSNVEMEHYLTNFSNHYQDYPLVPVIARGDLTNPINNADAINQAGTWSLNGQILTLTVGGEPINMVVSPDGKSLYAGGSNNNVIAGNPAITLTSGELSIGVRTNPPNIAVVGPDGSEIADDGNAVQVPGVTDQEIKRSIIIQNTGDSPLSVSAINSYLSSVWQIAENPTHPSGLVIAPGGQGVLVVGYTSNGNSGTNTNFITINTNDPDNPQFIVNLEGITP